MFGVTREKGQKIPLRHECDEFAARMKVGEFGDVDDFASEMHRNLPQLLMRLEQELIEVKPGEAAAAS